VALAFKAAGNTAVFPGADGGVVTDGRSIVIAGATSGPKNMHIPANQYFSCAGPPGAQRNQITLNNPSNAVPYYSLPNSIVLEPGTWTSPSKLSVWRDANSQLKSCIIRPTWYSKDTLNLVTSTTRSLIDDIERAFVGTATICGTDPSSGNTVDGEACDMQDMLILGFDVCDDTRASAHAVLRNVNYECNVGEFFHNNGGGVKLENAGVHNFIEAVMNDASGTDISKTGWQITNVTADANGEVKLTIGSTGSQIMGGDTILVAGFALGNGPQGQDGRWLVDGNPVCGASCTLDLKGSSYVGPSSTGSWLPGSNAISISNGDTTNIAGGQYLCTSTSPAAPFCPAPGSFTAAPTTSSTIASKGTSGTGNITIPAGGTANWPVSGLMTSDNETMSYKLVNDTTINLTARHLEGTNAFSHTSTSQLMPAAPMVIATIPSVNKVIVNAIASSAGSSVPVDFLNDNTYFAGSADCTTSASICVILNANYHTWTGMGPSLIGTTIAPSPAGSTPDAALTVGVSTHTGQLLTLASPYAFKVQPGMTVIDVTNLNTSLGYVDRTPTNTTQVHLSATPGSINGHQLRFSGCGYPGDAADTMPPTGVQPWLGNCAATAYLFYGADAMHPAAGTACETIRGHGWRVYLHMNNAQETVCNKVIFDSGSSGNLENNDTADATSVGIWVEGSGDKIELSGGKTEARTGFLNTGTDENNGVVLSDFNFTTDNDYSVVFANTARSVLANLHGGATGVGYADSSQLSLTLTGNVLQGTQIYFDDPVLTPPTVSCANNIFGTTLCSNLLQHAAAGGGLPKLNGAGGGSPTISGSDGAGRIVVGSQAGLAITLTFANPWPNTPVCFAQDETTSGSNPVYTAPTATKVVFNFHAAPSQFDHVAYQCTGF
jgi:hypothetical protein